MRTLWVGLAGAGGAIVRYRIGLAVGIRSFPWATLGINCVGCFLLALLLAGPLAERWSLTTNTALAVGFLGAFTTFSTFGYESFTLLRTNRPTEALTYAAASLAGGLAAVAAGYALGRTMA